MAWVLGATGSGLWSWVHRFQSAFQSLARPATAGDPV